MTKVIRALGRGSTYDLARNPSLRQGLAWGGLTGALLVASAFAALRAGPGGLPLGSIPASLLWTLLLVPALASSLLGGALGTLRAEELLRERSSPRGLREAETGLYGREFALDHLQKALYRQGRTGATTSILVLELGPADLGDRAQVLADLRSRLRVSDVLGRLWADRLLLVMDGELPCTLCLVDRLTEAVRRHPGATLGVSVARWPEDGHSLEEFLESAESMLRHSPFGTAQAGPSSHEDCRAVQGAGA